MHNSAQDVPPNLQTVTPERLTVFLRYTAELNTLTEPADIARVGAQAVRAGFGPCDVSVSLNHPPSGEEPAVFDLPPINASTSSIRHQLIGQALDSGRFAVNDEAGFAAAAFPLHSESQTFGALAVACEQVGMRFPAANMDLFSELAALISAALTRSSKNLALDCEIRMRDRQERELRAEVQRWVDILHNTGDMIQAIDAEGRFLFCNQAWHNILGYTYEQSLAMNVFDIIHTECRSHCASIMDTLRCGQSPGLLETQFVTASGIVIPVEGRIRIICDGDRFIHTVGIFRDMTERLKMEQELSDARARAQYMDGIHQAAITLQHEINNPLTALMGHAELLDMRMRLPERAATPLCDPTEHITHISALGNHIAAAVQRLRSLYDPVTTSHPTSLETAATMIDLQQSA